MPEDHAADYDDEPEPCRGGPLPPDDRLWRHPSELGPFPSPRSRGPLLTTQRAGTWSAGLAGALLATGIVLVATHIAASLAGSAPLRGAAATLPQVVTTTEVAATSALQMAPGDVSHEVAASATRIYESTVLVTSTKGTTSVEGAGLVIGADCLVIAAAGLVLPGAAVDLTLPDGKLSGAEVVGIDPATGLAVLRCPLQGMATIPDNLASASDNEMVGLVYAAPGSKVGLSVGLVTATDQRLEAAGNALLDEIETDIPLTDEGAALIDGDGEVLGVVVGTTRGGSVATPTWLALSVARQIADSGKPGHAWLGIDGDDAVVSGQPSGVRVLAVVPHSAAAKAGIRAGDLIRSVNGHGTQSLNVLEAQLYAMKPGDPAVIGVVRGRMTLAERATLDRAPAAA